MMAFVTMCFLLYRDVTFCHGLIDAEVAAELAPLSPLASRSRGARELQLRRHPVSMCVVETWLRRGGASGRTVCRGGVGEEGWATRVRGRGRSGRRGGGGRVDLMMEAPVVHGLVFCHSLVACSFRFSSLVIPVQRPVCSLLVFRRGVPLTARAVRPSRNRMPDKRLEAGLQDFPTVSFVASSVRYR